MLIRKAMLLAFAVTLAGCVAGYTLVQPGVQSAQDLQVYAGPGWNLAPPTATLAPRKGAQTWTQDGLLLDRLVLIPAVGDGEALIVDKSESAAIPVFHKDMLPNEVEELIESTIVKYFGEGNAAVSTSNLRPHKFGDQNGFKFDMLVELTDSPDYKGTIGAFIVDDRLYSIWYLAAVPHYFDKHMARADEIMQSARLVRETS